MVDITKSFKKPKKLRMYYHPPTNTTWVNDLDWEERRKTDPLQYGTIEINSFNVEVVRNSMHGFHRVPENPFALHKVRKARQ